MGQSGPENNENKRVLEPHNQLDYCDMQDAR